MREALITYECDGKQELYGGRRVLGVPRTSRDGGFFLIIDDEGHQLHDDAVWLGAERYKENYLILRRGARFEGRLSPLHAPRRTYEYADMPHSHIGHRIPIVVSGDEKQRAVFTTPGDRRASTITRLLLPAPTRICAALLAKNTPTLAETVGVLGLFDDTPRPIEARPSAVPIRRAAREHYLVATFGVAAPGPRADAARARLGARRARPRVDKTCVVEAGGDDHSCLRGRGRRRGVRGYLFGGNARGQPERAIVASA